MPRARRVGSCRLDDPDALAVVESGEDGLDPSDDDAAAAGLAPDSTGEDDDQLMVVSVVEERLGVELALTHLPGVTIRRD